MGKPGTGGTRTQQKRHESHRVTEVFQEKSDDEVPNEGTFEGEKRHISLAQGGETVSHYVNLRTKSEGSDEDNRGMGSKKEDTQPNPKFPL